MWSTVILFYSQFSVVKTVQESIIEEVCHRRVAKMSNKGFCISMLEKKHKSGQKNIIFLYKLLQDFLLIDYSWPSDKITTIGNY